MKVFLGHAILVCGLVSCWCGVAGAEEPEVCNPASAHRPVAEKMKARGFYARQFVGACGEVERWAPGRGDKIEAVAVLHYLGYDEVARRAFLTQEISLEDFRLRKFEKLKQTGLMILVAAGVPLLLAGGVMWGVSPDAGVGEASGQGTTVDYRTLGMAIFAVGGVVAASGSVVAIHGTVNERRLEAPEGLLETGSFQEIRHWNRGELASSEDAARMPSVSLALGTGGAGLSLRFSF